MSTRTTASRLSVPEQVARIVSEIAGITLGEAQASMVQSRLKRRMLELGLDTEEKYLAYLEKNRATETNNLVSLLTTHHTFFFREFHHFEFMLAQLPAVVAAAKARGDRVIRVWSAASSNGQEAYSIAMFLEKHLKDLAPEFSYEIFATDVDSKSIDHARNGVYRYEDIKSVPAQYLAAHWARGTGDISNFVKVKNTLKQRCRFEVGNLIKLNEYQSPHKYDFIFCRNVFIYFSPEQIKSIVEQLGRWLHGSGYLFVGISENIATLGLPIEICGASTYRWKSAKPEASPSRQVAAAPVAQPRRNLRVLCVDDSSSVLMLMKQILKAEHGFEIVGTAGNGLEAAAFLKSNTVDLMTLDIHMPGQDGLSYLQSNWTKSHPPVLMISSVAREDKELAQACLRAGAADYVEKPTLNQIQERGEEIRSKLKTAHLSRGESGSSLQAISQLSGSGPTSSASRARSLRILICTDDSVDAVASVLKEMDRESKRVPTLLLLDGGSQLNFRSRLQTLVLHRIELARLPLSEGTTDTIQILDFDSGWTAVRQLGRWSRTSILVFRGIRAGSLRQVVDWDSAQVLIEDSGSSFDTGTAKALNTDRVPRTSFAYMSSSFLKGAA